MPRSIALLRAINVGGHTVTMARLRSLFEELGFSRVETFIASGNVIFEAPVEEARTLEQQIERHLQASLGYGVATFIRSPGELAAIAAYQPFSAWGNADAGACSIAFLAAPPSDAARQKLMACQTDMDEFHVHCREVYWRCRTKISESQFSGALLEKTLGLPATLRNVTTVRKLAAKYSAH